MYIFRFNLPHIQHKRVIWIPSNYNNNNNSNSNTSTNTATMNVLWVGFMFFFLHMLDDADFREKKNEGVWIFLLEIFQRNYEIVIEKLNIVESLSFACKVKLDFCQITSIFNYFWKKIATHTKSSRFFFYSIKWEVSGVKWK